MTAFSDVFYVYFKEGVDFFVYYIFYKAADKRTAVIIVRLLLTFGELQWEPHSIGFMFSICGDFVYGSNEWRN